MPTSAVTMIGLVLLACLATPVFTQPIPPLTTLPVKFNGTQSLPNPNQVLNTPMDCSGWLEPRVYMESQSWFARGDDDLNMDSSHLHIGACIPQMQYVGGTIPMDLQIQKHQMYKDMNQSVTIEVYFQWQGGNTTLRITQNNKLSNWTCDPNKIVCKQVLSVWVDTVNAKWKIPDGVNQMSIKASVPFNDSMSMRTMSAELLAWVVVANKDPGPITRTSWPILQNSLTGFPWSYVHAHFDSSNTWNPAVAWANATAPLKLKINHISDALIASVSQYFGTRNPSFHLDPNPPILGDLPNDTGYLKLYDVQNETFPTATDKLNGCSASRNHTNCYWTYTIPANNYTDGRYKLFFRTDSFVPNNDSVLAASNYNKTAAGGVGNSGGTFSAINMVTLAVNASGTLQPFPLSGSVNEGSVVYPPPIDPAPSTWYFVSNSSGNFINPHNPAYTGPQSLPPWQNMLTADYYKCPGWSEVGLNMKYVEGQSWFTRPVDVATGLATGDVNATTVEGDLDMESSHLHVGACFPHGQSIAGILPIDIVLNKHMLREQQNITVDISVEFITVTGNTTIKLTQTNQAKDYLCVSPVDCKRVLPVWIATQNNQYVLPNGPTQVRVEARFGLFDGVSTRSFSSRVETWIVIANNAVTVDPAKVVTWNLGNTAKTDFPWSYTHANTKENPYMNQILSGDFNFKTLHFIETTQSNITAVFNTINPKFHKVVNGSYVPPDRGTPILNEWPSVTKLGSYCSKSGNHVDCNNVTNVYSTPVSADGFQRIFLRTDSFAANQDPIVKAFNMKIIPGKNGGTFSSVLMFAVQTQNTAPARKLLAATNKPTANDNKPEIVIGSLSNPPFNSPRQPIPYEVVSNEGPGRKPIRAGEYSAATSPPRTWVYPELVPWSQSLKGGSEYGLAQKN